MELHETEERRDLRKAVTEIAKDFGHEYYVAKSLAGEKSTELWNAVGKQGFLGVNITEQRILVIVAAVVTMVGLYLLLKRTLVGMSIEAMAQDREGALLVGIDTRRVALLTFAISGALAAVAGSLIAPLLLVFPNMGELIILKAFVIVILGGMGSVPGAILGGYLLALAETMAGTYVSFAFSELIAFGLLVLVLVIRPTGLFQKGV